MSSRPPPPRPVRTTFGPTPPTSSLVRHRCWLSCRSPRQACFPGLHKNFFLAPCHWLWLCTSIDFGPNPGSSVFCSFVGSHFYCYFFRLFQTIFLSALLLWTLSLTQCYSLQPTADLAFSSPTDLAPAFLVHGSDLLACWHWLLLGLACIFSGS